MNTHALDSIEIKAFVPAKDFELSKQFYQDMGFTMASDEGGIAYFHHQNCSFLLQDFYHPEHAENVMMHLLVSDVDGWYEALLQQDLPAKYGVRLGQPVDQPWKMRDFVLTDPSGVLWRIGQNSQ